MLRGGDVSAIQGVPPWQRMRDAQDLRFSYLRCGIGNERYRDAQVARSVLEAKDAGICVGPYNFAYPLPHLDPREQARYHAKLAEYAPGKMLGAEVGDLPPALDLEWPERERREKDGTLVYPWRKWLCNADQIREWGLYYLDEAEQLWGCRPALYSYRYFLQCIEIAKAIDYARYPLWLADYFASGRWPTADELARLRVPAPWSKITMIQHDGNGGLRLPNGVDADFCAFLGNDIEFYKLVGEPRLTPAENTVDEARATADALRLIVDEGIAAYRRDRLNDAIEAA